MVALVDAGRGDVFVVRRSALFRRWTAVLCSVGLTLVVCRSSGLSFVGLLRRSGNWHTDRLTIAEKLAYQRAMGFDK